MYYLFKFPHMYYSFPGFNQTVWYIFPDFPNLYSCQNLTPDQPKIDAYLILGTNDLEAGKKIPLSLLVFHVLIPNL